MGAAEILIVEDDEVIMGTLAYNLSRQGYRVSQATTGAEALKIARRLRPDLILLDIMLPGESGIEVCERIRERDQEVVIVMITAKDAEEDKVRGFEAGADDYVTKPFSMKELIARINANLRRIDVGKRGKILEAGDLLLDTKNYTARIKDEPLDLRLKEFKLLMALASAPEELKSREELAMEVWGHAEVGSSRVIDVHIRRLREALEERSSYEYVHTVRGLGYRFRATPKNSTGEQRSVVGVCCWVGDQARVLFLCTHNSARSQMAEGLLRHLAGDRFEVMSAGTEATHVRPLAIRAMEEIGIDISGQESKTLDRYLEERFDYVSTVCDDANEACPFFPGAQSRLHWSFEDPSKAEGSEEERLEVFRRVRDGIKDRVQAELVNGGG